MYREFVSQMNRREEFGMENLECRIVNFQCSIFNAQFSIWVQNCNFEV